MLYMIIHCSQASPFFVISHIHCIPAFLPSPHFLRHLLIQLLPSTHYL